MTSRLYRIPANACASSLGTDNDPLADANDRRQQASAPAPVPAPAQQVPYQPAPYQAPRVTTAALKQENHNDTSRQDPYRWYSNADAADGSGLRGRVDD
jgi:hypothetical protein